MRHLMIVSVLMSSYLSLVQSAEAGKPANGARTQAAKVSGAAQRAKGGSRASAGAWSASFFGQQKVREYLQRFEELATHDLARGRRPNASFVITGEQGAGATTLTKEMARRFKAIGLVPSDEVVRVNAKDLVSQWTGRIAHNVQQLFARAQGKLLVIEDVGYLGKLAAGAQTHPDATASREVIRALISSWDEAHGVSVVVLEARNADELRTLDQVDLGFRRRYLANKPLELDSTPSVGRFLNESSTVKVMGLSGGAERELAKALPLVGTRPNGNMRDSISSFDIRIGREALQRQKRAGSALPKHEAKVTVSDVSRAVRAMQADEAEWAAGEAAVAERRAARK